MQPTERKGCDSCRHGSFPKEGPRCLHPQRPDDRRAIVRWYAGCPQHAPKEKQ